MGIFNRIKNVFIKGDKSNNIDKYDTGLKKTRNEFVSQLSSLSKKYEFIDDNYFEE